MTDETIRQAEAFLSKTDPLIAKLISKQKLEPLEPRDEYFTSLARSIIGQQVSVAAARAISGRLLDNTNMEPEKILLLTEEDIKVIGLSKQKAGYIHDLAEHFVKNPTIYNHLGDLNDEDVIADLTTIKGIGVWTAQMFLMFTLGRPDVFAPDDGGLQRGFMRLHSLEALPPRKELIAMTEKWRPYRTVASLHLWQLLDNTPK